MTREWIRFYIMGDKNDDDEKKRARTDKRKEANKMEGDNLSHRYTWGEHKERAQKSKCMSHNRETNLLQISIIQRTLFPSGYSFLLSSRTHIHPFVRFDTLECKDIRAEFCLSPKISFSRHILIGISFWCCHFPLSLFVPSLLSQLLFFFLFHRCLHNFMCSL